MNLRKTIEAFVPKCEQEIQEKRMILSYMDLWDNLLTRDNETAHFTASGWIVNPARTHVLMAYHNIYKNWAWTGGHADGDDHLLNVALKEAQEETSIQQVHPLMERPISLEILTVDAHVRRGKYVVPHLHLNLTYLLEADDEQRISANPDENSAVRWFPIDEAAAATHEPAMQAVYQKLNDRLRAYLSGNL